MKVERPEFTGELHRSMSGSSRPKEQANMNPVSSGGDSRDGSTSDIAKIASEDQQQEEHRPQPSQPQPQQKKQVRRRLHTSRPYKERLLNMAEARREIVAALKSHRAAMKGAGGQQERQKKRSQQREPPSLERAQDEMRTRKNLGAHSYNKTSNSFLSLYNNASLSCPRFSWAYNSTSLAPFPENLSLLLPGKPLGLNLNYHDFNNKHIALHGEDTNPPIDHSSSSSFSSSRASSTSSRAVTATKSTSEAASVGLHPATGSHEEMDGIRSDGDEQTMEGNKKPKSSTSSLWCKILETSTERSPQSPEAGNGGGGTERDVHHMFDEALDMPPYWLEDPHRLDDYYPEECLQDAALPCGSLDIGEIEEMDCGWLS